MKDYNPRSKKQEDKPSEKQPVSDEVKDIGSKQPEQTSEYTSSVTLYRRRHCTVYCKRDCGYNL